MSPRISRLALPAFAATILTAAPCAAQDVVPGIAYLGSQASSYAESGYGYGGNLVDGSYVGAPLTRFPTPREIVPTPWGYGTYGVPTVSGIRRAPVGEPVVYVIEGSRPAPRRAARVGTAMRPGDRDGRWSGMPDGSQAVAGSGARIIQVHVPRR